MPKSCCAILLTAWSLWGLPTLCVGGLLEHLCDNHEQPCDECEPHEHAPDGSGCPGSGECDHESDCASDPCAGTIARYEQLDHGIGVPDQQPMAFADGVTTVACTAGFADAPQEPGPRKLLLPRHPSDLPLLI